MRGNMYARPPLATAARGGRAEVRRAGCSHLLGSLICVLISENATLWNVTPLCARSCVCVCVFPASVTCPGTKSPSLLEMTDWRSPVPPHNATPSPHPFTRPTLISPPGPPICSGKTPNLPTCRVFALCCCVCVCVCMCFSVRFCHFRQLAGWETLKLKTDHHCFCCTASSAPPRSNQG